MGHPIEGGDSSVITSRQHFFSKSISPYAAHVFISGK